MAIAAEARPLARLRRRGLEPSFGIWDDGVDGLVCLLGALVVVRPAASARDRFFPAGRGRLFDVLKIGILLILAIVFSRLPHAGKVLVSLGHSYQSTLLVVECLTDHLLEPGDVTPFGSGSTEFGTTFGPLLGFLLSVHVGKGHARTKYCSYD
jgi:hypothetical protein